MSNNSKENFRYSQLFVAWVSFQRRQESMAAHCGFELLYLPIDKKSGGLRKAVNYFRNSLKMLAVLINEKPLVLWFQLPQIPLLWVALIYRLIFRKDAVLIADCHNSLFRKPWNRIPFGISWLHKCSFVLVHNNDVLKDAISQGASEQNIMVVEDPPANFDSVETSLNKNALPRPWLIFPASFSSDEPIRELIEAAKQVPNLSVIITGDVSKFNDRSIISNSSSNVSFTGFLSREEFDSLIIDCDAVIAMTNLENVQLSVCGEAVGAAKPMLISNTDILCELFPHGTVFVDSNNVESISQGLVRLSNELVELKLTMEEVKQKNLDKWLEKRCIPLMNSIEKCVD